MVITKEQARDVLEHIRQAKRQIKDLNKGRTLCERARGALVALDVAELLVCDETTHEYREPSEIITLQKVILALDLFKNQLMDRVANCRETDGLFE